MAKSFSIMAEKSVKPPLPRLEALLQSVRSPAHYQIGLKKPELDLPELQLPFQLGLALDAITHARQGLPARCGDFTVALHALRRTFTFR